MKFYKLRVDTETVTPTQVLQLLMHHTDAYLYCYEGGDENPHMHFYLEMKKNAENLRCGLRKLGLSGNASYSLSSLDERYPMEYLGYIMKEKNWKNQGIPEDIITLAKEHDKKVKEQMKLKKAARRSTLEKIIETIPQHMLDYVRGYSKQIKLAILKYHKDNGLLIRKFQLIAYYDTITVKYTENLESLLPVFFE